MVALFLTNMCGIIIQMRESSLTTRFSRLKKALPAEHNNTFKTVNSLLSPNNTLKLSKYIDSRVV